MKKLIVLLGPNGVGKSTAARTLMERCPGTACVDADWCRSFNPFPFTPATKETATDNLHALIRNDLRCVDIQTVVWPYGLHGERQAIYEDVIRRLAADKLDFQLHPIILKCSMEETLRRCKADGRDRERTERGIVNTFTLYDEMDFPAIDTTDLSAEETVSKILALAKLEPKPLPKKFCAGKGIRAAIAAVLAAAIGLSGFAAGRISAPQPTTVILHATEPTVPSTQAATEPATQAMEAVTAETTQATEEATAETTQATEEATTQATEGSTHGSQVMDYIVNRNSLKFHYPDCESVAKMKESNKEFFTGTREELLERGCDPCGNCNP